MIRTIISALAGRAIQRGASGGGGIKGALVGAVAARVLQRAGPLGLVLGGLYLAKQTYDARKDSVPAE